MKIILAAALSLFLAQSGSAAPLQLKNRLVFTRGAPDPPHDEMVWTMNPDGGDQKRVWRVPKGYRQFGGFSRDGKLALSFNHFNLYLHDLTKHKIDHVLVWNDGRGTYINQPSFSPNGTQILCEVGGFPQNVQKAFLLKLKVGRSYSVREGLESVTLVPKGQGTPPKSAWANPRWTQDGKRIAAMGGGQIWMFDADDLEATQLTQNDDLNETPCLSPDQKHLAFVRGNIQIGDADSYSWMFVPSNVWVLDVVEKSLQQLTFNKADPVSALKNIHALAPLFSSDGTQITFQQRGDIYRIGADGKNQKRLTDGHLGQWVW